MTKITVDKALIEQAIEVLADKCGGRCNAEYNPCHALDVAVALRAALDEPAEVPDYRAMYLKVRDELAELQQQHEKCVALARSVMCDNTGRA